MFDTEGFYGINARQTNKRLARSTLRQFSNVRRTVPEPEAIEPRLRKNRSSKKTEQMMKIKLPQKTTPHLVKVWTDRMQDMLRRLQFDKQTAGLSLSQFADVMECFPTLIN